MKTIFFLILALLILFACSNKYDIIIIGGGAGGETYAYFTEQYNDSKILLLERGGDETNNPDLKIPNMNVLNNIHGLFGPFKIIQTRETYPNPPINMNIYANCLGGGSQVSAEIVQRPSADEIDYWKYYFPQLKGLWNYERIAPALRELEDFSDSLHPNNPISPSRGRGGILKIMKANGFNDEKYNITHSNVAMLFNISILRDANADCNLKSQNGRIGVWEMDRALGHDAYNSVRQTIYQNYLKQRASDVDSKIKISTSSQAVKILFKEIHGKNGLKEDKKLVAYGVRYIEKGKEKIAEINSDGRIIISASQQMSSVLLELSGIGNCNLLESLGIRCLYHSPGVGENLRDHAGFTMTFANTGLEDEISRPTMLSFFRSPVKNGPLNVPDTEVIYGLSKTSTGTPILTFTLENVEQTNTGSIHIQRDDPLYDPKIVINFTMDGADGDHFVWLFDKMRNFFSKKFKELTPGETIPDGLTRNDLKIKLSNIISGYSHGSGTCRFGSLDDPMAVLDEVDFRVKGTNNLYVVDASSFPFPMRGHPNIMIRAFSATLARLHHDKLKKY